VTRRTAASERAEISRISRAAFTNLPAPAGFGAFRGLGLTPQRGISSGEIVVSGRSWAVNCQGELLPITLTPPTKPINGEAAGWTVPYALSDFPTNRSQSSSGTSGTAECVHLVHRWSLTRSEKLLPVYILTTLPFCSTKRTISPTGPPPEAASTRNCPLPIGSRRVGCSG
jgi:hypothetical protein